MRYFTALDDAKNILDLGSGGGIPGLVIAALLPDKQVWLLDRRQARTDLLFRLVSRLSLTNVCILSGDAEEFGRNDQYRGFFDAVVCRSYSKPRIVILHAKPFLQRNGRIVVSESFDESNSWDTITDKENLSLSRDNDRKILTITL
jgi:16S rRNA (guanine527-N7)-methyltransferase